MKKFLSVLFIVALLFTPIVSLSVRADDGGEQGNVAEVNDDINEFKDKVSEWLSQYMEEDLVVKIVSWAMDAGILGALFAVYVKYKKYKHTTVEDIIVKQKENIEKEIKDRFNELSEGQIAKITQALNSVEEASQTIMKVLVLMQDSSAKGRAALIEYLGSKTNNEEIKIASQAVAEIVEREIEHKEEIKEKFEEIF